jgi:hypothetical protein
MIRSANHYRKNMRPKACKACGRMFSIANSEAPSRFLKRNACGPKCGRALQEMPSLEHRFWKKVDKRGTDECWIWRGTMTPDGYGKLWIGGGLMRGAHRISYELFEGPILNDMLVCHKCDVRNCVNPSHLFLGNNADNMADKVSKNRQSRLKGTQSASAKLTEQDVLDIRASGISQHELARRYGVTQSSVWSIIHRKTWSHLN